MGFLLSPGFVMYFNVYFLFGNHLPWQEREIHVIALFILSLFLCAFHCLFFRYSFSGCNRLILMVFSGHIHLLLFLLFLFLVCF